MAGAALFMGALSGIQGEGGIDPPKLSALSAIVAIGTLSIAGIVAGLYPARKQPCWSPSKP